VRNARQRMLQMSVGAAWSRTEKCLQNCYTCFYGMRWQHCGSCIPGVDCELRKKHAVWDNNYRAWSWKWKMRGELDLKYVTGWHSSMKVFIFRCLLQITSFIVCLIFSSPERHLNCCSTCQRMLSVCVWPGRFQEVMNLIIRKDTQIPPPVTGHSHKQSVRWRCVCVSSLYIITYSVWKFRVRGPHDITAVTFIVLLACHTHYMWHS
jgi:hypothetical protein